MRKCLSYPQKTADSANYNVSESFMLHMMEKYTEIYACIQYPMIHVISTVLCTRPGYKARLGIPPLCSLASVLNTYPDDMFKCSTRMTRSSY